MSASSSPTESFDVVIIGAGIAGAAAAYFLAPHCRLLILEREFQPGYHSTGRSAGLFTETYGTPLVRELARYSRGFLENPEEGFGESLLAPRGVLYVGGSDQSDSLEKTLRDAQAIVPSVYRIDSTEACRRIPVLNPEWIAGAVVEPDAMDIDVARLHQGYLSGVKRSGGRMVTDCEVTALARQGADWLVQTTRGNYSAPNVVNAAGAWCDRVASLAGLGALQLQPLRRTAIRFDPGIEGYSGWPLCIDVDENFYFRADAGLLMASLGDETPSEPCDAQPEEIDVALTVDRIERATSMKIGRIRQKWAGLRTFAPDRMPIVGFDPRTEGFFWLAGQGGYGIKTSPALGRITASLLRNRDLPDSGKTTGEGRQAGYGARLSSVVTREALSPERFLADA